MVHFYNKTDYILFAVFTAHYVEIAVTHLCQNIHVDISVTN